MVPRTGDLGRSGESPSAISSQTMSASSGPTRRTLGCETKCPIQHTSDGRRTPTTDEGRIQVGARRGSTQGYPVPLASIDDRRGPPRNISPAARPMWSRRLLMSFGSMEPAPSSVAIGQRVPGRQRPPLMKAVERRATVLRNTMHLRCCPADLARLTRSKRSDGLTVRRSLEAPRGRPGQSSLPRLLLSSLPSGRR